MKTWLTKFRISNALDDRKPLSPAVQRALAKSEELRRFAENSAALDQALENSRPEPEAPASLHASILRAVRTAAHRPEDGEWRMKNGRGEGHPPFFIFHPRSLVAASIFMLGIFAAIHFSRHPNTGHIESSSLAAASSALDLGGKLVREMPDAALSPLSDEMQRLNLDLASAQKFLLASLP